MTPSAEKHLQRHPHARPSKLKQLEKQDETTSRLQRENNEAQIKKAAGVFYPFRRAVRRLIGLGV